MSDKEKEFFEKGWIKTWMLFEVQATNKKTTETSLLRHIDKMKREEGVEVSEESYSDTREMGAPKILISKGIKKVYAKVAEVVVFFRGFEELTNTVIKYAPTSVEILGPESIILSMREAQNALTSVAEMMHRFAAAGIGGVLIRGE